MGIFGVLILFVSVNAHATGPITTSNAVDPKLLPEAICALYKTASKGANPEVFCTGTLVLSRKILTAAHCFPGQQSGETLWYTCKKSPKIPEDLEEFAIRDVELDSEFNDQVKGGARHDAALISLRTEQQIKPIRLASSQGEVDRLLGIKKCAIAGYGTNKDTKRGSLNAGYVKLMSREEAKKSYFEKVFGKVRDSALILKMKEEDFSQDIPEKALLMETGESQLQQGDSGGPLLCQDEKSDWIQIGIISRSFGYMLPLQVLESGLMTKDIAVQVAAPIVDRPLLKKLSTLETVTPSMTGSGAQPAK